MKKMLTAIVIDTKENTITVREVKDDINEFYKVLNCDCFDIARRRIGGKPYDILCDDMGRYVTEPVLSAINPFMMEDYLVGNLIIVNHKGEDLTSLTPTDIARIYGHTGRYADGDAERIAVMLG